MKGFIDFVRQQGVVGLLVGFMLGSALQKLVSSLIQDIINPILGIFLNTTGGLKSAYLQIGPAKILWGDFTANLIDFLVIAGLVYWFVKVLGLEKVDKKE